MSSSRVFESGTLTTDEPIRRHRCDLPRVTRRRRLGSMRSCSCGTTYRLECSRFGLGWCPVSSVDDVVRDRRERLTELTSIGLAP